MIRTLIVDDERPARDGLRLRIERSTGFQVVGEAADGRAAVAAIDRLRPDLVFLDVRMPDMNGFEVLRQVPAAQRPRVIFVTAYDEHAMRAFEVHALDYLLKPLAPRRLEQALERARAAHAQRLASRTLERLSRAWNEGRGGGVSGPEASGVGVPDAREAAVPEAPIRRLAVRDGERRVVVPVSSIRWIRAHGNYVCLSVGGRELLHRISLATLAERLPDGAFVRIHRTTLVNVSEVAEIHPRSHGDHEVVLRDGSRLRMSRRYRDLLQG